MMGVDVVWVPGTDHAGIATQVVVEKKLYAEKNINRNDIGRKAFNEEVVKWKEEKIPTIRNQLKNLGVALDWSRETFTMDQVMSFFFYHQYLYDYQWRTKNCLIDGKGFEQSLVNEIFKSLVQFNFSFKI